MVYELVDYNNIISESLRQTLFKLSKWTKELHGLEIL